MIFEILFLVLVTILLLFLFKKYILFLIRKSMVQYERIDGPIEHKKKNHTPSFGGVFFVILFYIILLFVFFLYGIKNCYILCLFFSQIPFFILGLVDDDLKRRKKKNDGISARPKFIYTVVISTLILILVLYNEKCLSIHFFKWDVPKILVCLAMIFLMVAMVHSTNLTDGVDGLLGGCSIISSIFFAILFYQRSQYLYLLICITYIYCILIFLVFNHFPAKIFMGDCGSLWIGGYLCALWILSRSFWLFFIAFFPYLFESLSVVIQVLYYKITKGKRFFRMAPYHHHLEKKGWSEKKVDILFYFITFLVSCIAIFIF